MTRETVTWLVGLTLLLVAMLLGGAGHARGAQPPLDWDPRLDALGVTYHPAAECASGCWRLVVAHYEDPSESGGDHHVFARLRDETGTSQAGLPWHVAWPDGDERLLSKPLPDWADFPLYGCYDPTNGPGGYRAYAGDDEARSDRIIGMGLPQCQHVNFRLIWQWAPRRDPSPTPSPTRPPSATPAPSPTLDPDVRPRSWIVFVLNNHPVPSPPPSTTPVLTPLPSATAPPSPTPLPSATAIPTPTGPPFAGEIVQTFPNCGLTQVFGVVHDAAGQPLPGTRLRLTWEAPGAPVLYATAGDYVRPETDASGWDFVLEHYPVANVWRVAIVDPDDPTRLLSNEVPVRTVAHCAADAVNVAKVRFAATP